MSLSAANNESTPQQIQIPADINWQMLNKSKFFFLGAALFSGVSAALYPAVVLKTRQQVAQSQLTCVTTTISIIKHEGFRGFYRGFGTSLTGTIPARALYMTALEVTKSKVGSAAVRLGLSEPTTDAMANAAAGLTAATAAQLVWTPVDVISQRLMTNKGKYLSGIDAFRKIVKSDGVRGLYRGFGFSIATYAPSSAVWWTTYSVAQRLIWDQVGRFHCKKDQCMLEKGFFIRPDGNKAVIVVQGVSAAVAGGVSAFITMPLDTIKTRIQVLDGDKRRGPSVGQTVRNLVREGGWTGLYRGLGPRWASMSVSAMTMITTYEFLKRLSTKNQEPLT